MTLLSVFVMKLLFAEALPYPSTFTVDLAKKCQVLMLHVSADRKAKMIATSASIGDVVVNLGCKREISQASLNDMNNTQRNYMAWKHPVWCKVSVGQKSGWVQKQYLKEENKLENHEEL